MQENKEDGRKDTASGLLTNIYNKNVEDKVKIGDLLNSVDAGGFALLILLCSLVLVVPTPPPISTIMAIFIMFFSVQMVLGFEGVWLPKFITEKRIERKTLSFLVANASIYLIKLEIFTRKRFVFMESMIAQKIIGIIIFFLAMITLIPIIFANLIPGLAIIFISFGLLNKDGLIMIFGFIIGFISIFAVWALAVFGKIVLLKIIDKIF